jgi:ATP-binding cassette subfamily C (CFTR/MRP) protein 1
VLLPRTHGRKVEYGSYDELCASGLLKSAMLETKNNDKCVNGETQLKETLELEELQGPSSDEVKDLDRKTGDLDVYWYYFRHIGAWSFSVFLFFAALNTWCGSFASQYTPPGCKIYP